MAEARGLLARPLQLRPHRPRQRAHRARRRWAGCRGPTCSPAAPTSARRSSTGTGRWPTTSACRWCSSTRPSSTARPQPHQRRLRAGPAGGAGAGRRAGRRPARSTRGGWPRWRARRRRAPQLWGECLATGPAPARALDRLRRLHPHGAHRGAARHRGLQRLLPAAARRAATTASARGIGGAARGAPPAALGQPAHLVRGPRARRRCSPSAASTSCAPPTPTPGPRPAARIDPADPLGSAARRLHPRHPEPGPAATGSGILRRLVARVRGGRRGAPQRPLLQAVLDRPDRPEATRLAERARHPRAAARGRPRRPARLRRRSRARTGSRAFMEGFAMSRGAAPSAWTSGQHHLQGGGGRRRRAQSWRSRVEPTDPRIEEQAERAAGARCARTAGGRACPVGATGYGRKRVRGRRAPLTEITCHARGAFARSRRGRRARRHGRPGHQGHPHRRRPARSSTSP